MVEMVGHLSGEDLGRWRRTSTRFRGVEMNPDAYSAAETENILMDYYRICGEMVETYHLDDQRAWKISPYTGVIIYGEWE